MTILQVNKPSLREPHINLSQGTSTLEDELDDMVTAIALCDPDRPDSALTLAMGLMARCTEIYLTMVRIENDHRKAKAFRTMQLQKVMDLIEFYSRGASRLIEVRRQDVELSR